MNVLSVLFKSDLLKKGPREKRKSGAEMKWGEWGVGGEQGGLGGKPGGAPHQRSVAALGAAAPLGRGRPRCQEPAGFPEALPSAQHLCVSVHNVAAMGTGVGSTCMGTDTGGTKPRTQERGGPGA